MPRLSKANATTEPGRYIPGTILLMRSAFNDVAEWEMELMVEENAREVRHRQRYHAMMQAHPSPLDPDHPAPVDAEVECDEPDTMPDLD